MQKILQMVRKWKIKNEKTACYLSRKEAICPTNGRQMVDKWSPFVG